MKKNLFLLLFLIFLSTDALSLLSQNVVCGQIIDSETNTPVPSVIVTTENNLSLTVSDSEGLFCLSADSTENIYFQQLAYNSLALRSSFITDNKKVLLSPHSFALDEIVVTPNDVAEKLFNKALENLNRSFEKNSYHSYLFHIEEKTSNGAQRELYALIDIALDKVKKKGYNWNFELKNLDKIKITDNKQFYIKHSPFYFELFPLKFNFVTKGFICEIEEENESEITVRKTPKTPDKHNFNYSLYAVSKLDTILTAITAQSLPDVNNTSQRAYRGVNWDVENQYYSIKIDKNKINGQYYVQEISHFASVRINADVPFYIEGKIHVKRIENPNNIEMPFKEKIKPYDYELFELNVPESPEFWKNLTQ
jgi:hypothetical protein